MADRNARAAISSKIEPTSAVVTDMSEKANLTQRRRLSWPWRVLGLVLALYILEQDVESLLYQTRIQPHSGYIGAWGPAAPDFASGYIVVTYAIDGPMTKAGVRVGDHIRFDYPYDFIRHKTAGQVIGFTLDHLGHKSHLHVIASPRSSMPDDRSDFRIEALTGIANIITALFGLLVIWRSHGRLAAFTDSPGAAA